MKEKNKKLIVIVSALLLVVGISFAYFTSKMLGSGSGTKVKGTTAVINGANISIEGELDFKDTNIMPGHKVVSRIKVTATGDNELIPYNLIWNGSNSLNTPLDFTVYKTSSEINVEATCEAKTKVVNGVQQLNEECTISNIEKLGSIISEGTIETSTETAKVILADEEFITAKTTSDVWYYYIILEYPNLDKDQSSDIGGSFSGEVTVEESNVSPDINIIAAYIKQEDGTYKESKEIPQEGYKINQEKSVCSNGAVSNWDISNKKLIISSLTKSGTSCYLYFDEICGKACRTILAGITPKETMDNMFASVATTDEGIFKAEDNDGTSYYYRGAVANNYLTFAGKWWRIIRINGDGTIRIIYDGTEYHANGTPTSDSIAVTNTQFNSSTNNAIYVGFKYGTTNEGRGFVNKSTILTALETWYTNNLATYASKIDMSAGFCGDRTSYTNTEGTAVGTGYGTSVQYFADYVRLMTNKAPVLTCANSADLYTVSGSSKGNEALEKPIGLINANEVAMVGGKNGTKNTSYYLYNGNFYWTMSPYSYGSGNASVFNVGSSGHLNYNNNYVNNTYGLRPVINLRADVELTGSGTGDDPFVVVGAE